MDDLSSREQGEPPPITLQPLGLADAAALQQVYEGAQDAFVGATGAPVPVDQASRDLVEAAGDDARYLLGIFLRERLVGVIDFRLAEPEAYEVRLGLLLLAQPYRRQRLGSWALRIFEEWLRRATPTEAVMLTVRAQDHATQAFLRSQGYAFTGQALRVELGPSGSSRLLWMRKDL
jgi:GNAT superfamily N-acetyltransferase